jgi:diguanylate cyclase (GGDEF)-like protein
VLGLSIEELELYEHAERFREATRKLLKDGEWSGEFSKRHKDGHYLIVESHWTLVQDDESKPKSVFCIDTDITHRKEAEKQIQHLAFYDHLTGLPNRQLLVDRMQMALNSRPRKQNLGALLFIDLDNFKTLNDALGHDVGDMLLKQVAGRLSEWVRDGDTVARFGGDEFVVMLDNLSNNSQEAASQAQIVGNNILEAFRRPFQLDKHEQYTTPSIGIALFNSESTSVEAILKRADIAMYQAKSSGRNTMRFFDPVMQSIIDERVELEINLRLALRQKQLLLLYQSQVDHHGTILGFEALIRWQDPVKGMISPASFIPLAEETGLILPIGLWVLEAACLQLVAWAGSDLTSPLSISVNVSAKQFKQPDFEAQVISIIKSTDANPNKLKLELTETMLVDNLEDIIDKMTALKKIGVRFSLDDFGTGYSSLSYLKRLPLSQLKIDQSFVRNICSDANDAAIACTIITLGKTLGLSVIAEGVETPAQKNFLNINGCSNYQGYLFSKPLPIGEVNLMLAREPQNI